MSLIPSNKNLKYSVLKALAWLSGKTPGHGVPLKQAKEAVLLLEGINRNKPPIPLEGKTPLGLHRRIGFAFRNQRDGYCGTQQPKTQLLPDGSWAITQAGLDSLPWNRRSGPTPALFRKPVLKALVVLSGQQEEIGVKYEDIKTEILRQFGIDPATTRVPLKGRAGIYRDITLAFRGMREGYCPAGTIPLTMQMEKSLWGVTKGGLESVLGKRCCITADWLGKRPPQFHQAIMKTLRKKMPQSARLGLIEEHHSSIILKWITRDSFRDRLEANKPPSITECCLWAHRSAISDIRSDGKDALGVIRGAKTATTRVKHKKAEEQMEKATVRENPLLQEPEYRAGYQGDTLDFMDVAQGDPSEAAALNEMLGAIFRVLAQERPRFARRYQRVFRKHFLEGKTAEEIAEEYNVDRKRVQLAIREVRTLLIKARAAGKLDYSLIEQRDAERAANQEASMASISSNMMETASGSPASS